MSIDAKIAQIEYPIKSGIYKVAQFYADKKPYLRFGNIATDTSSDSHPAIVERFADEAGLKTITDTSSNKVRVLPVDDSFKITGMGWCELNLEKKAAEFYGNSFAYELRIDEKHLKSIKPFSQGVKMVYNPRRYG